MKKILLIEPNPYHTDGLPGIVKYFSDLNYSIDIYIQNVLLYDNAFCLYPDPINLYGYEFSDIKSLLSASNIIEYDFVFFYSMEFTFNAGGGVHNIIQYLEFIPASKYGVLGIYHTTSFIDRFKDFQFEAEGRLFCLSDFQKNNYNIKSLTPIFFSENSSAIKRCKNNLVCIGGAFDENMLANALQRISLKNIMDIPKIYLYGARYVNKSIIEKMRAKIKYYIAIFAVYCKLLPFVGGISQKIKYKILRYFYLQKYVIKKGYVSFNNLFTEITESKYILVLINPLEEDHKHYMSFVTSGVRMLILGFNKVPIIHKTVAEKYGFDKDNSILFDETNLESVLLSISDFDKDYDQKSAALHHLYDKIYSQSLENLKSVIEALEKNEKTIK